MIVPFKEPLFTFAEVLTVTGAENVWLRTFIQRDTDRVLGTKHRTGRLMFSLEDIMAITILWGLNARLRVSPAAAWEVVKAATSVFIDAKDVSGTIIHIAFDEKGGVLVWTANGDVVTTWNGNTDENQLVAYEANQRPHIVFPVQAIVFALGKAVQMAQDWPEETKVS